MIGDHQKLQNGSSVGLNVQWLRALKSRERASAARGHTDTSGDKFWLAGIYFLVHTIFVALKLWIWRHFESKLASFCISGTFGHGFLLLHN